MKRSLYLTVYCSKSLYSVFCIHSIWFRSCEIVQAAVAQEERASKNTHRDINDDYFARIVVFLLLLWSSCENVKRDFSEQMQKIERKEEKQKPDT